MSQPINSKFNCTTTAVGSACAGSCDNGYEGSPSAICQANGAFAAVVGTCTAVTTGCTGNPSGQPANSKFECTNTAVNSTCTGSCNTGYTGSPSALCQDGGIFAAVVGSCTAVPNTGKYNCQCCGSGMCTLSQQLQGIQVCSQQEAWNCFRLLQSCFVINVACLDKFVATAALLDQLDCSLVHQPLLVEASNTATNSLIIVVVACCCCPRLGSLCRCRHAVCYIPRRNQLTSRLWHKSPRYNQFRR